MSTSTARNTARVAASLALVAIVLWIAGPGDVWRAMLQASVPLLCVVVVLHTGDRLLMAYKWWRLLAARSIDLSLGAAARAYYAASFAGIALPMTVGADVVRVGAVRGPSVSTGAVVASIAIERALGAVSQGAWCMISVALLAGMRLAVDLSIAWVAGLAAMTVVLLLAAMPASFALSAALARLWRDRAGLRGKIAALSAEYSDWRHQRRELAIFLALTFVEGAFPVLTYFVGARALGLDVSLAHVTAVVPIVYLIARLPFSFGGLGGEQGLVLLAAGALGWDVSAWTAVTFLVSPVTLLVALLPGAVAWVMARERMTGAAP